MSNFNFWLIIGFTGQILFSLRFFVQWVASERNKKSVIPLSFWYFSIGGSFLLLSYAIHRQDPVFILGQSMGFIIYIRNLVLIDREKKENREAAPDEDNENNK
jgi:lipid-A-disaccharide synthase-like uncharacterized protein